MGRKIEAVVGGTLAGFVVGTGLGVVGGVLHANVQEELAGCREEARLMCEIELANNGSNSVLTEPGKLSLECVRALKGTEIVDSLARLQIVLGSDRNGNVSPDLSRTLPQSGLVCSPTLDSLPMAVGARFAKVGDGVRVEQADRWATNKDGKPIIHLTRNEGRDAAPRDGTTFCVDTFTAHKSVRKVR